MSSNKLIFFCLFLLTILTIRIVTFYQNKPFMPVGKQVEIEGTIASEPVLKGNFQAFQLDISFGNKIYVTAMQDKNYTYGEKLLMISTIEKRVLGKNHEIFTTFLPKIEIVKNYKNPVLAVTSFVRQKITSFYNKTLPSDFASLLLGIVFGIKGNISKPFIKDLQTAGVLHVIAASGMNVTLVGGFLSSALILFFKRQWAIAITILGLFFYALLAGFQPSIVRATIIWEL